MMQDLKSLFLMISPASPRRENFKRLVHSNVSDNGLRTPVSGECIEV